ncbi:MAG: phosphoglycerate mutase family protein [Nanoarchaeota archaeon]
MALRNPDEYQKGKTIVYFIRHGDRIHIPNKKEIGLIVGGPGLSNLGKKQAKEVAKKFSKIKKEIDKIYSSDMNRAIETAEIIGKQIGKKPIIIKGIAEFNKIVWGNRVYHYKFWKHYLKHKASIKIFNKILNKNRGKVILIVAHGNVIKGIIGKKIGLTHSQINRFDYGNCHISLVRFKGTKLDYVHYFNSKELV